MFKKPFWEDEEEETLLQEQSNTELYKKKVLGSESKRIDDKMQTTLFNFVCQSVKTKEFFF